MPSASLSPDQLAREAQAAIERKDWAAADELLRRQLAATPDSAAVLLNLGHVNYRRGALAEAERFLNKAALRGAGQESWLLLGQVFAALGRQAEALRAYKAVLKEDPGHFSALMALGDLRSRNGDRSGARENYRQAAAARPSDADAALKYSESLWEEDPATALTMTLAVLSRTRGDPSAHARALQIALPQVELTERLKRGQSPYHGSHPGDLFFPHAMPYLADFEAAHTALAADPHDTTAKIALGLARFCSGDRHRAEFLFSAAAAGIAGGILDAVRFAPDFHAALRAMPESEIVGALPPIVTLRPPVEDSAGVLYLSCDQVYALNFALPMLCSLRDASPETPVHLHLIDASGEQAGRFAAFCDRLKPLRFALTTETPGVANRSEAEARNYFHAVRLIRLHQALFQYRSALWMADVDAIIEAPLSGLFSRLTGNDISLHIRPGRLDPHNQFNASVLGVASSDRARDYIRQVAAYIAHFHRRQALRWGIDQLALYAVFADLQDLGRAPALGLLGSEDISLGQHRRSAFWTAVGAQKFNFLEREARAAPAENEYAAAFAVYRKRVRTIAAGMDWKI